MSTTDDTSPTSTPDATLDPAMLDEVEQALSAAAQGGGEQTGNGGIPVGELPKPGTVAQTDVITRQGGGVARPNGGIPVGEIITVDGTDDPNGGIPVGESGHPPTAAHTDTKQGGVARPNGGIPHGETVHP